MDTERRKAAEGVDAIFLKKKLVFDWKGKSNSCSAFFKGKLRYNDYQIIISFITAIFLLIVQAVALCGSLESSWGITVTVPFLHYYLAILSLTRHLNTDFRLAVWEIIFLVLSFVIQYGWGVVYFINEVFDADQLEAEDAFY